MQYFHNPKCRKSREGLDYLVEKKYSVEVVCYLDEVPDKDTLKMLFRLTQNDINSLVRFKEARQLGVVASTEDEWIQAIQKNPVLLERPILIHNGVAIIGRPHERFREFVDTMTCLV